MMNCVDDSFGSILLRVAFAFASVLALLLYLYIFLRSRHPIRCRALYFVLEPIFSFRLAVSWRPFPVYWVISLINAQLFKGLKKQNEPELVLRTSLIKLCIKRFLLVTYIS